MKTARPIAALSLALLLGACWYSELPLITASDAETPAISGVYIMTDSDNLSKKYTVSIQTAKTFKLVNPAEGDAIDEDELTLDHLFDAYYLAQSTDLSDDPGTSYFRILNIAKNGDIHEYDPFCDDDADAAWSGVEISDNDCKFTTYDGLRAAAMHHARLIDDEDELDIQAVDSGIYIKQ
jgi:hypothetical protein